MCWRSAYGKTLELQAAISISLELASRSMEFGVCYGPIPGGAEGLSTSISGREVILINSEMRSERRQRFTLAHELGHCLLRHPSACRPQQVHGHSKEPEERAANQFAASLLMPLRLFRQDIKKVHPRMEELSALADSFGVSRIAATLRYVQYTDDNCAVVGVTAETCWLFKSSSIRGWWVRNSRRKEVSSRSTCPTQVPRWRQRSTPLFRSTISIGGRPAVSGRDRSAGPGSWIVLSGFLIPMTIPILKTARLTKSSERRRNSFRMY